MAMVWSNRNDRFNHSNGNEKKLFKEHNESMGRFHNSHTHVLGHNGRMAVFRKNHAPELLVKVSRRGFINTMWPLLITSTMRETGGLTGPARMIKA